MRSENLKKISVNMPLDYLNRKMVVTKQLVKFILKILFYTFTLNRKKLLIKLRQLKNIWVIKQSGQFDFTYYHEQYPDVRTTRLNGIIHYVECGAKEGRNPNEIFDTSYYLEMNPDVEKSGINPFLHFVKFGLREGRNPNLFFDLNHFYKNNSIKEINKSDAIELFVQKGWWENQFFQLGINREKLIEKKIIDISASFCDFMEVMKKIYGLHKRPGFINDVVSNNALDFLAYKIIKNGLFNPLHYLLQNSDLVGKNLNLYTHFIRHGIREKKVFYLEEAIENFITSLTKNSIHKGFNIVNSIKIFLRYKSVGVVCHSKSNNFFAEIREYFVNVFQDLGINTLTLNENDLDINQCEHFFIIAPHEFFLFYKTDNNLTSLLQRTSVLITEQPNSKSYFINLEKTFKVRNVFDMNYSSMLLYNSIVEKKSNYLPLGYNSNSPFFRNKQTVEKSIRTSGIPNHVFNYDKSIHDPLAKRPVDLLFFGSFCNVNRRRMEFFAHNSLNFSKYNNLYYFVDGSQPQKPNIHSSMSLKQSIAIAQRSKILLNIHQLYFPYFDWRRIVWLGIAQKCLVITENNMGVPFFKSEMHFLSDSIENIPKIVSYILETDAGREKAQIIVDNAYKLFIEKFDYSLLIKP